MYVSMWKCGAAPALKSVLDHPLTSPSMSSYQNSSFVRLGPWSSCVGVATVSFAVAMPANSAIMARTINSFFIPILPLRGPPQSHNYLQVARAPRRPRSRCRRGPRRAATLPIHACHIVLPHRHPSPGLLADSPRLVIHRFQSLSREGHAAFPTTREVYYYSSCLSRYSPPHVLLRNSPDLRRLRPAKAFRAPPERYSA